jgi:hypothetical protein
MPEKQIVERGGGIWIAVAAVAILLSGVSLAVSYHDSIQSAGNDLRFRVVGARLLASGRDPYSPAYQDESPLFAQPMARRNGPSGVAYDPFLLLVYVPLSSLPYLVQRRIGWVLEWSALAGCIAILAGLIGSRTGRRFFLVSALLLFACSQFWRLHTERGQYYVLLLLLGTLSWLAIARLERWRWIFTIPLAMAAAILPPFGAAGLALVALGRFRDAVCFFGALAVFVAMTLPFGGLKRWADFNAHARELTRVIPKLADVAYMDSHYGTDWLDTVHAEGATFDYRMLQVRTTSFVAAPLIQALLSKLNPKWATSDSDIVQRRALYALAGSLALLLAALWVFRMRLQQGRSVLMACLFAAVFAMFFAPIRYSYFDVIFLLPLAMMVASIESDRRVAFPLALLMAGLIIGAGNWSWLTDTQIESARPLLAMLAMAWMTALPAIQIRPAA